jgi:hypothetical protein
MLCCYCCAVCAKAVLRFPLNHTSLLTEQISQCSRVFFILMVVRQILLSFAFYLLTSISLTSAYVSCFMPEVRNADSRESGRKRFKVLSPAIVQGRSRSSSLKWADKVHSNPISTAVIVTGANGVLGQSIMK